MSLAQKLQVGVGVGVGTWSGAVSVSGRVSVGPCRCRVGLRRPSRGWSGLRQVGRLGVGPCRGGAGRLRIVVGRVGQLRDRRGRVRCFWDRALPKMSLVALILAFGQGTWQIAQIGEK